MVEKLAKFSSKVAPKKYLNKILFKKLCFSNELRSKTLPNIWASFVGILLKIAQSVQTGYSKNRFQVNEKMQLGLQKAIFLVMIALWLSRLSQRLVITKLH